MTAEDHIKRVKFAKYMKANYSQEIWKEELPFIWMEQDLRTKEMH